MFSSCTATYCNHAPEAAAPSAPPAPPRTTGASSPEQAVSGYAEVGYFLAGAGGGIGVGRNAGEVALKYIALGDIWL